MRLQCAITTFTRSVTVAPGVFAPGHLGELTRYLPFELVDAVLQETGKVQQRLRDLPSRVGVYFLLAAALFPHLGYAGVWGKLVAGLAGLPVPAPSAAALRHLRRRLGPAPFKALFEVVAGPLARPRTAAVRYRHYRTVALDGCKSVKAPDSERNRSWLGRVKHRLAWSGYPTVMLMALVETGTRGLLGAAFGPATGQDTGECAYATGLLPLLDKDMLLLADRGFDSNKFLAAAAKTGARLLIRIKASRRPPVVERLPDGSFLSRIGDLKVRIIDADVIVTGADGIIHTHRYQLATTLLDHLLDPAARLIRLYHERWEVESTFFALRHTMLAGHVLRSGDPSGIEQELWAQLTAYQLLRTAMVAAVESRPGTDPDRAGFTTALDAARQELTLARGIVETGPGVDLVGTIGHAVLGKLLDPRRPRFNVRKVKSPLSRYHARPKGDERPLTSMNITDIAIVIHASPQPPLPAEASIRASKAARSRRLRANHRASKTAAPVAKRPASGRQQQALALMRTDPSRTWNGREVAQALGITNHHSLCVQMSQWARRGLLRRTSPATYALADQTTT